MPFVPTSDISKILLSLLLAAAAIGLPTAAYGQDGGDDSDALEAVEEAAGEAEEAAEDWMEEVDDWFGRIVVAPMVAVLFYNLGPYFGIEAGVPAVVVWLAVGAVFLTFRMGFINFRAFWHAIRVTKGDYDDDDHDGEVSHFQALSSALSATVGLGNIGSVAVAVGIGGPGAIFWMVMCGLFGMTSKFTECSLGQMYRRVDPDGHVSGGPMRYLSAGLREMGLGPLGAFLAVLFAVLCIGASFGGGCAFQVSQSRLAVNEAVTGMFGVAPETLDDLRWVYGLVMAALVGIVIIGGIRRIAATAEKIVPLMCAVYVTTALVILGMNADQIGAAFGEIFQQAWAKDSIYGGAIGAAMLGIKRAAFSNEAGVGSAAIAHSAARTNYPVREGIVALLEPFIDTVVICTITGLVIVVSGVAIDPANAEIVKAEEGATITSLAFGSAVEWFPYVLAIAVILFAYSTMISWSYYGERCATYLLGPKASMPYRLVFLVAVFFGAVIDAKNVLTFSDLMILSMAIPNMIGLYLMSGKVKRSLNEYWAKYKHGDFGQSAA
ncbi:Amino-acid carrier protein AlsT [Posidoniimonas corsicana]|uniref:Amino-acid carrier protein AlsT n=1 Tax=Posidoniimonas corsicana TaxID=1938618 RepID=A0A5C5VAG7_9BACT|nr:alanine/glycine:cation symporter family protein [Posidoniimonas corsicana]TWT35548.1 Amino-acid carrier protein AlsT [Posidoniimonas corsicana]